MRPRRVGLLVALPLIGCLGIVFGGFALFLTSLDRVAREPVTMADGIVALTGGAGRVDDALELLSKGFARRLLITGVNEHTTLEKLGRATQGQRDLLTCCVDLDYRARNTVGNAVEISRWAREKGFRSLIVVTSYYHLPRALAELDDVLPGIRTIPYGVVAARSDEDLAVSVGRMRVLFSEYVKFVAVSLRRHMAGWLGASAAEARRV